ncbi:MAG: efflux transporter outer membrane subunit [Pirellulaceae bacterium]
MLQLGLGGCMNREATTTFPTQAPPPFSSSGDVVMADRWWKAFEDSALNHQIGFSLDGSYTLAAALERLRAARALTRREASDLWPDVNGVGVVDSTFGTEGQDQSRFVLGLDASYQVDLWGQIESRVDAERLRASATHADYHAIALTLSADVARTWFSLIEANAQLALLDEQLETNRTGLELQEWRFGSGLIRAADVLRQRQLVESTLEQAVVVRSRIEVLEHLLAVLEGRPPQESNYDPGTELPALPPLPDTGLPSELLNRRPDVRRDFLAFRAADRDLASAVSAQYPRINLTGSLTNVAESPEDLFREWFVSIGGQLIAPLIDGGQRRAEVDRTASVAYQRFNEYGQTMLNAYREVEDSLARERYLVEQIDHLNRQVELASQASMQLREQYQIGDVEYLDVLSAITAQQRLQRETLSARLELIRARIALYLALAGSFDTRPQFPGVEPLPENVINE